TSGTRSTSWSSSSSKRRPGVGLLALGEIGEDFLLHGEELRGAGDESRIPGLHELQGLVGRRRGIENRVHGTGVCASFPSELDPISNADGRSGERERGFRKMPGRCRRKGSSRSS